MKGNQYMKKKSVILFLLPVLLLSGCAGASSSAVTSDTAETSEAFPASSCSLTYLEDDRVELTVPSDYVQGATQTQLDTAAKELGYESITLNEDGSATYIMTKAQHQEMLKNLSDGINEKLNSMIRSENYSDITAISANDDYTVFSVTTTASSTDVSASMYYMVFSMYGDMYNAYNGIPDADIRIDFFSDSTGELLTSFGSAQ
jgi:PBP1b-binding outer membrane lipoprotein LpoB